MKANKEIDNLGRILIPIEFRKKLQLKAREPVILCLENNSIIIKPEKDSCKLCGSFHNITQTLMICQKCIQKIKKI